MEWVSESFSSTAGVPGDGSLVYDPVRLSDGSIDVEASLAELRPLYEQHLRQGGMHRWWWRRGRRLLLEQHLAWSREVWERINRGER